MDERAACIIPNDYVFVKKLRMDSSSEMVRKEARPSRLPS